ncbi:MAG TPA: creatininase family protein [Methylomirabilota bacterium]|jgi:creatinine amidohydrolase/Fe(II)-dependent formamide hydrolase-like protein|nr:creatininase family protein [Methylomirabilota bacterium]
MFARIALAAGLLCIGAATASGQTPDAVFLEELTWTELRELMRAGKTTVIVPTGGTEQNGPHMALGKHNVRVKALSDKIARSLGNALVAPVLAYVPDGGLTPPTGHMRFAGTLTTPDDVFQKVLESAARSLKLHGFRDIVLLGDHAASQAGQKAVAARLNREWAATAARVHAVEDYYRAGDVEFRRLLQSRGHAEDEIGRHAGLADTSLMMAIDPRMVRTGRLRSRPGPRDASGVDGDPARASPELGQLGVELVVARTVEAIRKSIGQR